MGWLPCGIYNVNYNQELDIFRTRWQKFLLLASFVFFLTVPTFFAGSGMLSILTLIGITIISMQGLNFLMGYTGQISLGQAAFMAVGAYTSAILADRFGFPFLACLISSGIVSALLGMIFGLPSLKVKGFYLAITTLAAHFIIMWAITHGGDITGEIYGLTFPYASIGGWVLDTDREFYAFTIFLAFLFLILARNITRSHVGRAFIAIRDNDIAAGVMGINVFRSKLLAFFLCSFYAGIAGSLLGYFMSATAPDVFPFLDSIWYLGFLVAGGMGSIMGPVFGSILWRGLREGVAALVPVLQETLPGLAATAYSGFSLMLYSLVIILFLVFEPRGINHRWSIFKSSYRLWPFTY